MSAFEAVREVVLGALRRLQAERIDELFDTANEDASAGVAEFTDDELYAILLASAKGIPGWITLTARDGAPMFVNVDLLAYVSPIHTGQRGELAATRLVWHGSSPRTEHTVDESYAEVVALIASAGR